MLFPFLLLEILVFWLHQSHAQTLCNSTVLVDNQQKTVYRLSGTSLDLIAGNTTRIGWTLERNDSSGQQVLQIGSNFAYPNGSATQLLRIQLIGSDLDAAKFRYLIRSSNPLAPVVFISNFVSISIGTPASITKTNLSDNGTVTMFERTQRTIHIESEGLPDVSKAVLKMDKGMWVDAKSGLFTFTDKQLVINSQSVNDSGKYTIVVSNCFSNVTRDFNLIVGTRPVLAISQNHVSVLCGNAFSVNYTVSGFPVPIVSCCKTQPCADNLCGNNQLFIGNAGISQNGSYSIVADNGFGKDEQTLSVSVRGIHVDPVLPFSESIDCSKSLDVDTIVDVYPFEPITANVVGVSGKVPKLTTSISTEKGSREFCGESVKSFQLVKMTFERQSTVYTGNYSLTVTSSTGLQRVFNFSRAVNSTEDCRPSPPVIEEPETDVCVGSNVDVSVQFQCPSLQLGIKGKGSLELTVPNEEKKTTFESAEDSCQNPVSIKIPKLKQDTQYSYKLVTVASGLNSRSVDGTFITRNDCEVGISWWVWLLVSLVILGVLALLLLCFHRPYRLFCISAWKSCCCCCHPSNCSSGCASCWESCWKSLNSCCCRKCCDKGCRMCGRDFLQCCISCCPQPCDEEVETSDERRERAAAALKSIPHDKKVKPAEYAETGPGALILPDGTKHSPKTIERMKAQSGEEYAKPDISIKTQYARPNKTNTPRAQNQNYMEPERLDFSASDKEKTLEIPEKEETKYSPMNKEQLKPRDHRK